MHDTRLCKIDVKMTNNSTKLTKPVLVKNMHTHVKSKEGSNLFMKLKYLSDKTTVKAGVFYPADQADILEKGHPQPSFSPARRRLHDRPFS